MSLPQPDEIRNLMTMAAVAKRINRSVSIVRIWVERGVRVGSTRVKLRVTMVSGCRRLISLEDLERFHEECRQASLGITPEQQIESAAAERRAGAAAKARAQAALAAHYE
jgi:transposase